MKAKQLSSLGGKSYAVVLRMGEEVVAALTAFAQEHLLYASHLTAIGAFSDVTLGYFARDLKRYGPDRPACRPDPDGHCLLRPDDLQRSRWRRRTVDNGGVGFMHSQRAISALNGLIEACKDAERGFRVAAEGAADHAELRLLFHAYAQECVQFAAELQAEVRRIGGHPEDGGSVLGAMHRGWRQIKAAVAGRAESTLLSECEAEEDAAVKAYDAALEAELGPKQRDIVTHQRAELKRAQDRIRVLKDASRAAPRAETQQ